jgi:lactate dehydrogenase-like 2-hydroxyacid dehydrogenase
MSKHPVLIYPDMPELREALSAYEVVSPTTPRIDVSAAVVAGHHLPNEVVLAFPGLKLIACVGVGLEGIDLPFLRECGITVTNGVNINHEDVADIAIGLLIGVARRFPEAQRILHAGRWVGALAVPPQRRLRGMKMGIVGMGAIGQAIAERAKVCGLDIAWTGPNRKPAISFPYQPSLIDLARWADVLAVAARGEKNTDRLIGANVLDALGPNGILINVSRGSLVDEDALIVALRAGRLWGAGLDVFSQEPTPPQRWRDVPNVMLTPHLGGGTRESLDGAALNVHENLRRHFAGEPLLTPVRR